MNYTIQNGELYHYGVKGMKWGHRKSHQSLGNRFHSRSARKIQADADNLRKHGYKEEAAAVQKVADKQRAKAAASQARYDARQAKRSKNLKNAGKAVGNAIKKSADKRAKRNEAIRNLGKDYGMLGVTATAVRSGYNYKLKKHIKGIAASTINSAANAYISSSSGSYRAKQGADFVRKAAIGALSVSNYIDQAQTLIDIGNAYAGMSQRYAR